jgi:hypothetical protein
MPLQPRFLDNSRFSDLSSPLQPYRDMPSIGPTNLSPVFYSLAKRFQPSDTGREWMCTHAEQIWQYFLDSGMAPTTWANANVVPSVSTFYFPLLVFR